ncbi:MAG: hypothetical protein QGI45_10555 [Myxococcota bacterium]|nr:hypothetical protein [Myxococcota bacterium]
MSENPKSLKRFGLLAIGLVILLLGVANMGELTGQASGGKGGCGGSEDIEYHTMPLPDTPIGQSRAFMAPEPEDGLPDLPEEMERHDTSMGGFQPPQQSRGDALEFSTLITVSDGCFGQLRCTQGLCIYPRDPSGLDQCDLENCNDHPQDGTHCCPCIGEEEGEENCYCYRESLTEEQLAAKCVIQDEDGQDIEVEDYTINIYNTCDPNYTKNKECNGGCGQLVHCTLAGGRKYDVSVAGTCGFQPPPCIPDCEDKQCGPDGCGGSCGECEEPESCNGGQCTEDESPTFEMKCAEAGGTDTGTACKCPNETYINPYVEECDESPTFEMKCEEAGGTYTGTACECPNETYINPYVEKCACPLAPSGMDLSTQMTFYCDEQSPGYCPWHSVCGADPNLDEESYGPTDPKSYKNCCECFYLAQPLCEGTGRWECTSAHKDCQWIGGECKSRHHVDCDNWVKADAQKDCHKKVITRLVNVYDKPEPAYKDEKPACTEYRYQYEGHGRNPANLVAHVSVCIDSLPTCGDIYITDTGCSTFQNLAQARQYILELVEQFENEGHQCVRIQANQCSAGNWEQTYYQFSVTKSGICHEGANQCRIGSRCHYAELGDSVSCQDGPTGPTIEQTCCSAYLGIFHLWRRGNSCN